MRPRLFAILPLALGMAIVVSAPAAAFDPVARPHVIATVDVGDGPSGIGVNPLTNRAYVADFRANTVSVIDGSTLWSSASSIPRSRIFSATACRMRSSTTSS